MVSDLPPRFAMPLTDLLYSLRLPELGPPTLGTCPRDLVRWLCVSVFRLRFKHTSAVNLAAKARAGAVPRVTRRIPPQHQAQYFSPFPRMHIPLTL